MAPSSLLTLMFGLLPALLWAQHALADDRVLRVQDGAAARQYAVTELIAAIGLTELRVAKDPHFGPDRVFAGFALEPLLDHIGLGDAGSCSWSARTATASRSRQRRYRSRRCAACSPSATRRSPPTARPTGRRSGTAPRS
jgi:hypothetical protein